MNMTDFLDWARNAQQNNLETRDQMKAMERQQQRPLKPMEVTPSIEDAIRSVTDEPEAQVEESVEISEDDEKDFKPHMMYDPKTGKGYKAKTYQDHLRMDKMGYVHDKPEIKKESVELDEAPKMQKKDAPFTVVALKGKKVLDSIRDLDEKEVKDAVKMMKMSHRGAKISVEAKGGKVVHTESATPNINTKHLELDNRLNELIKKLVV
tara:strand:+ start:93 stop:716 length:624 start_codon:yes stop_codon:yes gene_type:complete